MGMLKKIIDFIKHKILKIPLTISRDSFIAYNTDQARTQLATGTDNDFIVDIKMERDKKYKK